VLRIDDADGGYVVYKDNLTKPRIFVKLEDVLAYALLHFEGRCEHFNGDKYGSVEIRRIDTREPA
jgi:hypothetical protein